MKTFFDGYCGPMGLIREAAVVKTSRSGIGLGMAQYAQWHRVC